MEYYDVIVTNDVLGNSVKTMSRGKIHGLNVIASRLADMVDEDGKEHSCGMWTVRPSREAEHTDEVK